jgi:hypothetical protein
MQSRLVALSLLLLAGAASPALAQSWRPPMVLWTTKPGHVGFYFGPHYFSDTMGLTAFLKRFGSDQRTLTDDLGFRHLYFFERGTEVVATRDNQILSFTFYCQESRSVRGFSFKPAQVITDTGLGPGNTWNDVWTVSGPPHDQKADELGDRLYILEYHLNARIDLDFFFKKKASKEPIYKMGLYQRR